MKDFFTENIKKEKPGSTGLGAALSYSSLLNEANEHYHKAEKLYEEIIRAAAKEFGYKPLGDFFGYSSNSGVQDILTAKIDTKKKFAGNIEKNRSELSKIQKKT